MGPRPYQPYTASVIQVFDKWEVTIRNDRGEGVGIIRLPLDAHSDEQSALIRGKAKFIENFEQYPNR